jgi:hypothetical protein
LEIIKKNMELKLKCFAVLKDCGDGSQSCSLVASKEDALESLDRTEEELKEGCFYEDGAYKEVTMKFDFTDGKLTLIDGFYVSSDS